MLALTQFTDPAILEAIGHIRLAKFLEGFSEGLRAANVLLPEPPDPAHSRPDPAHSHYFESIAAIFAATSLLPERLRAALFTLEAAASPENRHRLLDSIRRRIPCVSVSPECPLDCALELWFLVPDELSQFAPPVPPKPDEGGVASPKPEEGGCSPTPPHGDSPVPAPINYQLSPISLLEPWPEPVDGKALLDGLAALLRRFVILPKWGAETLALWIVHTYAFELRDVSTYLGIESPEKRCGKTTLLTVLSELVNRPVVAANISSPAFFRVIEEERPTLLIDEADTLLLGNDELRGILNSGYTRKTAYVVRVERLKSKVQSRRSDEYGGSRVESIRNSKSQAPNSRETPSSKLQDPGQFTNPDLTSGSTGQCSRLAKFSCWCPKALAAIGRLPDTLADRCIVIRMQRKTSKEQCERLRKLEPTVLRRQCARFVMDHGSKIARVQPETPSSLHDRAADIWEPLFALADLAGGEWPQLARDAAVNLSASTQSHPIALLLLDIFVLFATQKVDRMFSRDLVARLNASGERPWAEMRKGKEITELWLSQQLRPYGIQPRNLRIGERQAKGYLEEDLMEVFRRYLPKAELEALFAKPS